MLTISMSRTLSMEVYQHMKYNIDDIMMSIFGESPLAICNRPYATPNWMTVTCFSISGAVAGAASSVFSSPFESIKIARQLSSTLADAQSGSRLSEAAKKRIRSSYSKKSTFEVGKAIIRNHGFQGLYAAYPIYLGK
jgi:hypothetical protein